MKKILLFVSVIVVATTWFFFTKTGDQDVVQRPVSSIPTNPVIQPTPVADSDNKPTRAARPTVGGATEFPAGDQHSDRHDHQTFVTSEEYFEYISIDSM